MVRIKIHPKAKQNFDDKASALLLELKSIGVINSEPSFVSDFVTAGTISDADMLETPIFNSNETKAFFDRKSRNRIGLTGNAFQEFKRLVDQLYRDPSLRESVSSATIESHVFSWMEDRYTGSKSNLMTDDLIASLENLIKTRTVYVPIAATAIESSFMVGSVRLAPLTLKIIDSWQAVCVPKDEDVRLQVEAMFAEKRRKLQGFAVAILDIDAEPDHARDVALELAEQSLSFLRVFSPANADAQAVCYTRVKGRELIQSSETIVVGDENINITESIISPRPHIWEINSISRDSMLDAGLRTISDLLLKKHLNSFQSKILDALSIYSKSSLEHEPEAKLIYVFSALETLLLKNESEPIQQNIGERIAFLTTQEKSSRRRIIQNVKAVYGLRSKFFHHGHGIDELDDITNFMRVAWDTIITIISNASNFETKEDFISALEDLKLS